MGTPRTQVFGSGAVKNPFKNTRKWCFVGVFFYVGFCLMKQKTYLEPLLGMLFGGVWGTKNLPKSMAPLWVLVYINPLIRVHVAKEASLPFLFRT